MISSDIHGNRGMQGIGATFVVIYYFIDII